MRLGNPKLWGNPKLKPRCLKPLLLRHHSMPYFAKASQNQSTLVFLVLKTSVSVICSCSQTLREKGVRVLPVHLQLVFRAAYFGLRGHRRGTDPCGRYLVDLIYLDYLCLCGTHRCSWYHVDLIYWDYLCLCGTHRCSWYLVDLIYWDYLCLWSHRRGTDRPCGVSCMCARHTYKKHHIHDTHTRNTTYLTHIPDTPHTRHTYKKHHILKGVGAVLQVGQQANLIKGSTYPLLLILMSIISTRKEIFPVSFVGYP
jgi:hypothetical protein